MTVTTKELERIEFHMDLLSDMDMGVDGSYAIEWDGAYGHHWEYFRTEEERTERLERYNREFNETAIMVREEMKKEMIEKGKRISAEKKFLRESRTLGGQFPILGELLVEMR